MKLPWMVMRYELIPKLALKSRTALSQTCRLGGSVDSVAMRLTLWSRQLLLLLELKVPGAGTWTTTPSFQLTPFGMTARTEICQDRYRGATVTIHWMGHKTVHTVGSCSEGWKLYYHARRVHVCAPLKRRARCWLLARVCPKTGHERYLEDLRKRGCLD